MVVLIVLALAPLASAHGATGSLTFCVVVTTPDGEVADDHDLPTADVKFYNREQPSAYSSGRRFEPTVFTTPLSMDRNLLPQVWGEDAACKEQDGLKMGHYFYRPAMITESDHYRVEGYTDLYQGELDSLNDFKPYSGELFDDREDSYRNRNTDGHIVLSSDRPDRMLAVHVVYDPHRHVHDDTTGDHDDGSDGGKDDYDGGADDGKTDAGGTDDDGKDGYDDGTGDGKHDDGDAGSDDQDDHDEPVDTRRPVLLASDPPNGGTDVPVNTTIELRFDEPVRPGTRSVRLLGPSGTVATMDRSTSRFKNDTVVWDPEPVLKHSMGYLVSVDRRAVKDAAGNRNSRTAFTFSTAPAPEPDGSDEGTDDDGSDTPDTDTGDDDGADDDSGDQDSETDDGADGATDDPRTDSDGGKKDVADNRHSGIHANICERSDFQCTPWTRCRDGTQTRECERPSSCVGGFEPPEERGCTMEEQPVSQPPATTPPDDTPPTEPPEDEPVDREPPDHTEDVEADGQDDEERDSRSGLKGMLAAEFASSWGWWLLIALLLVDVIWFGFTPLLIAALWLRINPWQTYRTTLEPREY